jgi:hypothetical protein
VLLFALALAASAAPSRAQSATGASATGTGGAAAVTLTSPLDFQVFQRRTRLKGKIEIDGHINVPADRIEERLTGDSLRGPLPGNWVRLPFNR